MMTMNIFTKFLFASVVSSLCSASAAQEETCSSAMTEFSLSPQDFDSILINPTCTSGSMFTTSQLAWTIEPTTDTVSRIYSQPPEAVKALLQNNVLSFDLNNLEEVPDKAGVVIQVPENQLLDVTVDGIMNYVRIARGFKNLMSINSLGTSSVVQADLSDSPYSKLIVDTSNSMHDVTAENLSLQMYSVSSKVYITGSVMGGEYSGFDNHLMVEGDVRDLSVSGNQNMLASPDCSTVVVDSISSSCTNMDEVPSVAFPSIPCTFPGCEKSCISTSFGSCLCTEAECDGANSLMDEMKQGQESDATTSSAGCSVRVSSAIIVMMSVVFASVAALQ